MSLFLFNCRLIESARVQLFSCRGEVEKNCRSGAAFFHGPQIVLQSLKKLRGPLGRFLNPSGKVCIAHYFEGSQDEARQDLTH